MSKSPVAASRDLMQMQVVPLLGKIIAFDRVSQLFADV
jgi:hypothetical protein